MAHSGTCVPFPEGSAKSKTGNNPCVKCGKCIPPPEPGMPRDVEFERQMTRVAHQAAGLPVPLMEDGDPTPPTALDAFAEARALPGNVIFEGRDMGHEAADEFGDARNYCAWEVKRLWPLVQAGDSEASARYAQMMRGLQFAALGYDAVTRAPS